MQNLEDILKRMFDIDYNTWSYKPRHGPEIITKKELEELWNSLDEPGKESFDFKFEYGILELLVASEILRDIFGDDYVPYIIEGKRVAFSMNVVYCTLDLFPELKSMPFRYCNMALRAFQGFEDVFTIVNEMMEENYNQIMAYFDLNEKQIRSFACEMLKEDDTLYMREEPSIPRYKWVRKDLFIAATVLKNSKKARKQFMRRLRALPDGLFKPDLTRHEDSFEYDYAASQVMEPMLDDMKRKIEKEKHPVYSVNPDLRVFDFDSLMKKYGSIKKLVFDNDKETLNYVSSSGVDFAPYINLTDPHIVYDAVEKLRTEMKGSPAYQIILNRLRNRLGLRFADLTKEDVNIFADEIAGHIIRAAGEKKAEGFERLEEHVKEKTTAGPVSFRLLSRDRYDLKLGDMCGDCTASDNINDNAQSGWISDINTQILKLYYNNRFIGRLNMVLVEYGEVPSLVIDAIEFIPQARKIKKYHRMAREAFVKGLEKIKEIAAQMNIKRVAANLQSNSKGVDKIIKDIGYERLYSFPMKLMRKKPLNQVVGLKENIFYLMQSRSTESEHELGRYRNFEYFLNTHYFKDPKRKKELKKLIRSERIKEAAEKIVDFDIQYNLRSEIGKIFGGMASDFPEDELGTMYEKEIAYDDKLPEHLSPIPLKEIKKIRIEHVVDTLKYLYSAETPDGTGVRLAKIM